MEEKIAELGHELLGIALINRVRDLVDFLDRVGEESLEGLFAIPRASALRVAKTRHHLQEVVKSGGAGHLGTVHRGRGSDGGRIG